MAAVGTLLSLSRGNHSLILCRKATLTRSPFGNGPPIAKPLSKGGCACPCRQQSTCTIFRSEILASRVMYGNGTHTEKRNQMKTSTTSAIPIIEAKSPMVPHLPDRPQERDPGDFLPWLPCTLALDIPVVHFTVGDLLSLTTGSIVETAYHQSSDLPLRVNGQLVGWTEFEVVGERLAVRLTDLS
jgi:flagellar motor switch/type III secretory pathway protein FliN